MTVAIRNALGESLLSELLAAKPFKEFWQPTEAFHGASERTWPDAEYQLLILAEHQWRESIGRVIDVARTTACIRHEGRNWCVVKLYYEKHKDDLPTVKAEADGRVEAPLDPVPAVRPVSGVRIHEDGVLG